MSERWRTPLRSSVSLICFRMLANSSLCRIRSADLSARRLTASAVTGRQKAPSLESGLGVEEGSMNESIF